MGASQVPASLGSPSRSRKGHFTAKSGPGPPTEAPRAAQDRPLRPQELVGPPTEALRAAQDRPQTPQEQSRTANKGPRNRPGPPTEAPRTPLDCPQKAQEQPRTAHRGPDYITSFHRGPDYTTSVNHSTNWLKNYFEATCRPST